MNKNVFIFIMAIASCVLSCKSTIQKQDLDLQEIIENIDIETVKGDTIEWSTYNDSLRMYTLPKSSFVLSKDENNHYHFQDIQKDRNKKVVIVENECIKSGSYLISGKEKEKFTIKYNSQKQPIEIRRFTAKYNAPLKLKSIEKYKYENNLIASLEFIDSVRVTPKHYSVSILMSHNYDSSNRLSQTLISKKIGKRNFIVVDSVRYFYLENENIPYSVTKSEFEGTKFNIKKSKLHLKIEKKQKALYKDSISEIRTTYSYKYDITNRIIEYKKETDINIPDGLKEIRYEKYVYDYFDKENMNQIPMLLYELGDRNLIPNSDINWYFTSNVEIDQYPDIFLRTDLGYFDLPNKIEKFKSYDGSIWFPISKYEIK